jgi:hypothetical protein
VGKLKIGGDAMAFTEYTGDTTIIGALGTNPAERGLTTQEFKDKFDQFADEFVAWFNETHLPEVAEKAVLDEHKAETVNYVTDVSKSLNTDGTGAGEHTISISLPSTPKKIRIDACIMDTNFASWGEYGQNKQNCLYRYGGSTGVAGKMGNIVPTIIFFGDGGGNHWVATVTSVSTSNIVLNWTKDGTGFTGTAYLRITAETH